MNFEDCLRIGDLKKEPVSRDLIEKEFEGAVFDLNSAKTSLKENNTKWATTQCYYAVFHAAKSLVLSKGYRERSHGCLLAAFGKLFVDAGIFPRTDYELFESLMRLRQSADYRLEYLDAEGMNEVLNDAEDFISRVRSELKK